MEHSVVLFDGLCNLCEWSVQFIIKRDPKNFFRFATLQSVMGQTLLQKFGLSRDEINTVVFVEGERCHTKSSAGLQIARRLNGFWPLLFIFIVLPKFLRDRGYDWIVKNRYQWFGKKEVCMIPSPELKEKFLS